MGDDGRINPQFSVPVCNQFKPHLMDGKLCYVMDVKKVKDVMNMKDHMGTKHGAQGGLSFVMDYNYLRNMGNTDSRNMAADHLNGLCAL